jgi:hypothetical protein
MSDSEANRYLAGDVIPYDDLRRVRSDTVGWIPTVDALGYANFFAQVRAVNLGLPADNRIRVWLGDPPIDWSKIKTQEDFFPELERLAKKYRELDTRLQELNWKTGLICAVGNL